MAEDQNISQYVTFLLDNQYFGMDIRIINEVNPNVNITKVPLCEQHIKGHVNVRGQVVLILDLMVIFGRESRPVLKDSHIIIFKTTQQILRADINLGNLDINIFGDKPVGILVDNIGDVLSVSQSQIETPTSHLKDKYFQFMDGIVKTQDNLFVIIDPVKILKYSLEN